LKSECQRFITGCRRLKVTPHVAAKNKHSAVDGRIWRHEGYQTSLKVRKRIEESFGWIKTVGGRAKTKLIGQAKLTIQALLCFATYNLGSAWAAWAAGGTRTMRKPWDRCPRKGRDGLKTGPNGLRNRCADASGWPASSKSAAAARSMSTFQRSAKGGVGQAKVLAPAPRLRLV
jgi:hypothetical protein